MKQLVMPENILRTLLSKLTMQLVAAARGAGRKDTDAMGKICSLYYSAALHLYAILPLIMRMTSEMIGSCALSTRRAPYPTQASNWVNKQGY